MTALAHVVDTNVPIVANGRNTHADLLCQQACIEELRALVTGAVVVIDESGLILEEYAQRLRWAGAPGVGDAFFRHVFDHQHQPDRVQRVSITPINDDGRGFAELPSNDLDPSDRKFLATASVARASILNATDGDWHENQALTAELGVTVRELCPHHLPEG